MKSTPTNNMSPMRLVRTDCISLLVSSSETMNCEMVGTQKDGNDSKETKKLKEPTGKYITSACTLMNLSKLL